MAVSEEYKAYIKELLEPFGPVVIKRMFGGAGIFVPLEQGDLMIGLIAFENVHLKVDETNCADYEEEGKGPFIYGDPEKPRSLSYYEIPERLYDDPDELSDWARKALDVALRANTKKPKKKKQRKQNV